MKSLNSKNKKVQNKETRYSVNDLYEIWDNTPSYIIFEESSMILDAPPVQAYISRLLGTGVPGVYNKQRHFLTVNEIMDKINSDFITDGVKFKKSNVYYHLDRLLEQELIYYVHCLDGQYKRKYFGKSAKNFLFFDSEETQLEMIDEMLRPFYQLLNHYESKSVDKLFEQIKHDIFEKRKKLKDDMMNWIKLNDDLLVELEVNTLNFVNHLENIYTTFPSFHEILDLLKPHLQFLAD